MDTSFNLENFISNLASLAREPFDPEALPDLLEQVTGHRWTRSASTSTSAASASVSAPSVPSAPSAPSASTPHLAAAAVVAAAAAAAAAGGGGGGDARQEEYKSKTKTDTTTTNHEDDSLETTTIADPLTTSGPSSSAAAAAINDNDTDADVDEDDDFDVDDDHTAFKSCTSHDNSGHHLYDQPDPHRFPNGNLCYAVNDPTSTFNTSWAMLLVASRKGKGQNKDKRYYYHSCLGIYECPVKGCKVVSNPTHPRKKKIGAMPTKARGSGDCRIHNTQLVHVPCNAKMNLRKSSDSSVVDVEHKGYHIHQRPHEKPSNASKEWLKEVVTVNKEALPNQISCGNDTRLPAGDVHPSFQNQDRLRYEMKRLGNKVTKFALEDLPKFEEMTGEEHTFIKRASLNEKNGTISIQFPAMLEVTQKNGGTVELEEGEDPNFYAFQTDSIEGWVHSATHSSMNVTLTSAYSTILKRHIAVLISIMFGRSGDHYAAHFCTLLEGIGYKEYNEFETKFPGNICDFSLGEKAGWEKAVRSTFKIDADVEIQLENSYKCCAVHFQRSVTRVKSSHSLVPRHKLEDFEHKINILLCKDSNRTDTERFYKTVEEIRKDFPLLKDWINWYVTNNIEKCFFSAVSNGSIKGFGNDTNAQEGTGRWLKRSDPSKKPSICSCIEYLYLRGKLIQQDTEAEKEGRQSRYRRGGALNPIDRDADSEAKNKRSQQRARSRKRAYENDGRAPDTEALLTPPKKRAKNGRPTGSTNNAPRGNDIVDRSFGIPWSYKNNGAVVSNTCSMDSVLMLLYMLRKFNSLPQVIFADDEVLTKVLNQIEIGQFDAARIYWISELTAKFGDSVFNSMTDLDCDASVHSAASSLFQMGVLTEYDECQFIQENCPHYCDYINVPGIRGSGMTTESFLYLGNGNTYGSLQQYFDCQHNGFGMLSSRSKSNNNNVEPRLIATEPCGRNIVLEGRKPGCTGKRMQRKVIQHHPRILEVVIPKTTDGNHPVTKPSHIEHSLTINEQKYKFVGAVLYGGNGRSGHYQSLFFIGGKFATYDGMLAKNKIVWIKEDKHFRAAFHAAKLWYVPLTDLGGIEVHAGVGVPTFDFKIGVPYGLLFGLKRNIGKVEDDHCEECNEFIYPYNPCLMARDKMGDGEAQVIQYFHLHCCSQRFKSRASEVFDAVDVCSFPNSAKVELRKMLVGDFHASNQVSSMASGQPTDYSRPKNPPKRSRTNDGRVPDTNKALFPSIKQSTGRKPDQSNKVPSGTTIVPMDVCIPWGFVYITSAGETIQVTNTCAMDTVLMGLFLLRQHDHDLQLKIKEVAPLDSVLDKIHQKKFDEARYDWIEHSRSCDNAYLSLANIATSTYDGLEVVTEWNCAPGLQFGDAMKELLCFEFYNEYSFCTGDGGEMKCSNYDEYHDNTDGWSSRGQMRENISISARDLKKGLQANLDQFFNEGGSGEEVDCGVGTKLVRNERGKFNDCDGKRTIQRVITDGPPILILERGIMAWEQSQIAPRSRTVDCMGELEHFLRIGDHRYVLVYCILSNSSHFQGIAIIYGKYMWYDGIPQVKMKWINADTPFPKDYAVTSLWYKLVDDDDDNGENMALTSSKAKIASAFAKSTPATQQKAFDNVVQENARGEENIRAPTPDGDKKPAATQKHNLEVEDNNNEEKGVEIAREERKEICIGTSSSSSSSDCSKTLSELIAEWELDLGGNFPVLTIEAGDSITHWNNATVGDRFHQRTVIVTTVKDNHEKLYCPLVVDNGDWIHKEQMVWVERHSIRAPLRNFTLVPSGDQLASSTKIGSERISGILMKHAKNLLGEGNSLEKDCLQLPTPTENSRKKTKGKEMNNVGSTRERCETEAKECKRSKNKMCIRKMCASCCKLAGEGGEKCRLKNHQS